MLGTKVYQQSIINTGNCEIIDQLNFMHRMQIFNRF